MDGLASSNLRTSVKAQTAIKQKLPLTDRSTKMWVALIITLNSTKRR